MKNTKLLSEALKNLYLLEDRTNYSIRDLVFAINLLQNIDLLKEENKTRREV